MAVSRDEDLELDQLLARGRLSGRQYDEIERRVVGKLGVRQKRWLWPALVPVAALGSALGAWLLIMSGGSSPLSQRAESGATAPASPSAAPGFSAKGEATAPHAGGAHTRPAPGVFEVGCGGSEPGVCRLGETLLFSITGSAVPGYLGAYAERVGDPSAPRIWYFPSADGEAPQLEARAGTQVLARGVRLGAPHVPGPYQVTVWISEAPPERADAEQRGVARASLRLEIAP